MSKYKIAIGLTTGPDLKVHCVGLVSAFQAMSGRDWSDYEFDVMVGHGIYIPLNRNKIARNFLQSSSDYLLFLDHDNGFFPEAFDQLMDVMENHPEVLILSGAYYLKNPNMRIMVAGQKAKNNPLFQCEFYPEEAFAQEGLKNITKDFSSDGGLVGAGFLLIRREALEIMDHPYFDATYTLHSEMVPPTSVFMGEDNYFCLKAQEAGIDLYLDTRIKSPHMMGSKCFPPKWNQIKELS
jgi:GT2 family glycosyltransferase